MFTNLANELGHHLMSVLKHVGQRRSQILCVFVLLANKENIKIDQLDV
jgi:hypothetical protein